MVLVHFICVHLYDTACHVWEKPRDVLLYTCTHNLHASVKHWLRLGLNVQVYTCVSLLCGFWNTLVVYVLTLLYK